MINLNWLDGFLALSIYWQLVLFQLIYLIFCFLGIPIMTRAQTSHPLDPLSAAEISVAVATVRAAGATPEVCYCPSISFSCASAMIIFE